MKVKTKIIIEKEIKTKQRLKKHIINVFNNCLKNETTWYIAFDDDNYIDLSYEWDKWELSAYISLYETYLRDDYTLEQLVLRVMNDNFILFNFE